MNNEKFPKKNPLMDDDLFAPQSGVVDIVLGDDVPTAAAPLESLEKRPSNPLMGPEIITENYEQESLDDYRVVQFKATDGREYIAHRISDLGYTVTTATDKDERSTTISKEDAAKLNFAVGALLKVNGKTIQVKEITHKIR